jgi:EmrB/QacA subfamily drug resistance transporter
MTSTAQPPSPPDRAKSWVLALTAAGSFMAVLDTNVVATSLCTIRIQLHASIEALEWTMNAYALSFAVLLLTGSALGDRYGRRRMFVAGVGLFVLASAACALAPSIAWLIAARTAQGAGAALVMPLAMALLSASFPPAERGRALGLFSGINGLALIVGPVIGGLIAEGAAWQWIFWLNIPLGAVVIPLAMRRLPESVGPSASLDIPGVGLVTGAALGVVWALMRGNAVGWLHAEILAAAGAGLVLAVAFVGWELRSPAPMVPMRFFHNRAFSAGVVASVLFYGGMYGVLFFLPQFLQFTQGHGAFDAGLRILPWMSMLFLVGPVAGSLVNRFGERRLVVIGLILQAAGVAWIAVLVRPDLPYGSLVAPLVIAGGGVSMAMPAAQNAILSSVARVEVGQASGAFNMFRFLGAVLGTVLASAVFTGTGGFQSAPAFTSGFAAALGVSAALSLAGAVAGFWLPARRALILSPAKVNA